MADERPNIVVVDVVPPELTALKFILQCRDRISAPVLLVTERTEWDSICGYEIGEDGYFARRFGPVELGARIRVTVHRSVVRKHDINAIMDRADSRLPSRASVAKYLTCRMKFESPRRPTPDWLPPTSPACSDGAPGRRTCRSDRGVKR